MVLFTSAAVRTRRRLRCVVVESRGGGDERILRMRATRGGDVRNRDGDPPDGPEQSALLRRPKSTYLICILTLHYGKFVCMVCSTFMQMKGTNKCYSIQLILWDSIILLCNISSCMSLCPFFLKNVPHLVCERYRTIQLVCAGPSY